MQKLLLHTCCGPCSTAVLEALTPDYDLTLYFYNPNLDSAEEYTKRLTAQQTAAAHAAVELIAEPYDPNPFTDRTAGLESTPEGGARCTHCFTLRLEQTAKFAKTHGFDRFTTTLSVSPHKNADLLNQIGTNLAAQHGIPYLPVDFKQKNGYHRSVAIAKDLKLYRQPYCGCQYSRR